MAMNMTKLDMVRDINGFNSFGLPQSNTIFDTTLIVNISQQFTVPATGDATYPNVLAVFFQSPGSSIFVSINSAATLPGASFALTSSEQNPQARKVNVGDTISFITADAVDYVGVALYAIQ